MKRGLRNDGRLDKLQAGQDDLRTKYGEMNEKQGYIVNAQKTIAKMQAACNTLWKSRVPSWRRTLPT